MSSLLKLSMHSLSNCVFDKFILFSVIEQLDSENADSMEADEGRIVLICWAKLERIGIVAD